MSNSEWADFHAKFTALPLTEKFRGLSDIHQSFSDTIFSRDDKRISEADQQAYTGLCRRLYAWTVIDQKPAHETDQQTALAQAIAGDSRLQDAAKKWNSLDKAQKLEAMDRVQQLHGRVYGIDPAPKISVAPRYMNAGHGMDATYDHDHLSPERCENRLFADAMDHFGDAVQATLHGASMRVTEERRMTFFGGSDDTGDPEALQGSMFHMDYFTSGDLWGHEDGEYAQYVTRPRISYARETAAAVIEQIKPDMQDATPTITDTKREAVYRVGKIEEELTDGRIHDRDRSLERKVAAFSDLSDDQISILDTGLKAHILADIQYAAAEYDHEDGPENALQKQAFELGNRITRLTQLEPEFVEHQQKLEEHLVNRMRNDPDITKARKEWKTMSNEDRLGILERAITMHAEVFGFEKPDIELMHEEKNQTGSLVNGTHQRAHAGHPNGLIKLNTFEKCSFHNFQSALNTALHESTHAHQNQLAAKFATSAQNNLNTAEKKQAQQFFWTTNHAFYGYVAQIGYDNYKQQQMENHAFSQGGMLSARVAAKPDLRERVDRIARRVQNFAQSIGQKVSLARPQRKTALQGSASA